MWLQVWLKTQFNLQFCTLKTSPKLVKPCTAPPVSSRLGGSWVEESHGLPWIAMHPALLLVNSNCPADPVTAQTARALPGGLRSPCLEIPLPPRLLYNDDNRLGNQREGPNQPPLSSSASRLWPNVNVLIIAQQSEGPDRHSLPIKTAWLCYTASILFFRDCVLLIYSDFRFGFCKSLVPNLFWLYLILPLAFFFYKQSLV